MRGMNGMEAPMRRYSEDRFTWIKFLRDSLFFAGVSGAVMYFIGLIIFGHRGGPALKWQLWGYLAYGLIMAVAMRHQYSAYVRLYTDHIVGSGPWDTKDLPRQSIRSIRETTLGTLWYARRGLLVSQWRQPWATRFFGSCVFIPASAPDYDQWKYELANWPGATLSSRK
jgi:hypothetical protein